jgi:hypothetical protein
MWSAGKEGPTAQVLPELKLQDLQAREDYDGRSWLPLRLDKTLSNATEKTSSKS